MDEPSVINPKQNTVRFGNEIPFIDNEKVEIGKKENTEHSLYYSGVLKQLTRNEVQTLRFSNLRTVNDEAGYRTLSPDYYSDISIRSMAILPNRKLVIGCEDGYLHFYNKNKYYKSIHAHNGPVAYLVVLSNGLLISGCNERWSSSSWFSNNDVKVNDRILKVWDVASSKCLNILDIGCDINQNNIAGLSKRRFIFSNDKKLEIWHPTKGCLQTLEEYAEKIRCFAALSNGKVVSVFEDHNVKLLDPIMKDCLRTMRIEDVRCVVGLPNGIAVFGCESTLEFWNMETGSCISVKKLKWHNRPIYYLDVFPNGLLVSLSLKILKLWDPESKTCLKTFEGFKDWYKGKFVLSNGLIISKEYASSICTLRLWDASDKALSADEQYEVLNAISKNKSLITLDLRQIDLRSVSKNNYIYISQGWDLLKDILRTHPALENISLDLYTLTQTQLKEFLVIIFSNQNQRIKNLWIEGIPVFQDGKVMGSFIEHWPSDAFKENLPKKLISIDESFERSSEKLRKYKITLLSSIDFFKQDLLADLRVEGNAAFERGYYSKALSCQKAALAIDPTFDWQWQHKELNKPFHLCINHYYANTYFVYQAKRDLRDALVLIGTNEQKKLHLEQLYACLDAIFNLKFLEVSGLANKNSFEELILPSNPEAQEDILIDNLLAGWLTLPKMLEDQLKLIKHISNLYLKSWHQESWIAAEGYFTSQKQERSRFLHLLDVALSSLSRIIPNQDFTPHWHKELLLLLLEIDAGIAKEHKESGIKIHYLFSEYDLALKGFMMQVVNQVKVGFDCDVVAFEEFLLEIEAQIPVQLCKLRQEQLGRAYTGPYHSQFFLPQKRSDQRKKEVRSTATDASFMSCKVPGDIARFPSAKSAGIKVPSISVSNITNFCSIYNLSDQAQSALSVFHAQLVDLLQSHKIMSSLAKAKLLEIKEKGNWANIKQLGWTILKAAPMVGTAMKYAHIGCQIVGQAFDVLVDEAQWIEKLTEYLEYIKTGAEVAPTGIQVLEYWDRFKQLSEGVDAYMRKLIDGTDLTTEASFNQFASVFKADAGKDGLERFVYSLLDRYYQQIRLLKPKGALKLADAIYAHLEYLFLLNFNRWNLAKWGEQRCIDMLAIMRHWVSYVHFLKDEEVKMQSGKKVFAQNLLQDCGIFFNLDEKLFEVDVILDQDETAHLYLMSDSGKYGYRKAEPELVEEFKEALVRFKSGDQLFSALQAQFSGKKTKEELEMLKELGNVLGVRFSPRLLAVCQSVQSAEADQEVIWEPEVQLLKKRMDKYEEKMPAGCVSQEEFDKKVNRLNEEILQRDELLCAILLSHTDPALRAEGEALQKTLVQKRADFAKSEKSYGSPVSQAPTKGSAHFPARQEKKNDAKNCTTSFQPQGQS